MGNLKLYLNIGVCNNSKLIIIFLQNNSIYNN